MGWVGLARLPLAPGSKAEEVFLSEQPIATASGATRVVVEVLSLPLQMGGSPVPLRTGNPPVPSGKQTTPAGCLLGVVGLLAQAR